MYILSLPVTGDLDREFSKKTEHSIPDDSFLTQVGDTASGVNDEFK
jgi:hypothetical protein